MKSIWAIIKVSQPIDIFKIMLVLTAVSGAAACAEQGLAGNIDDGEKKSAICGQCHGKNGIAIIPIYPNLAGQKEGYLALQLSAFRSGQRVNAAMTPHAQNLSDQDIADLAAFYANMEVPVKTSAAKSGAKEDGTNE